MKKKTITLIGLAFIIVIIAVVSFVQSKKHSSQRTTQEYITNKQSTSEKTKATSSNQSTSIPSSSTAKKESKVVVTKEEQALINAFLEEKVTYDLTVQSLLERSSNLSKIMTKEAYEQSKIQSTTDSLVAMTNKWLTTKQVNTSSGDVQFSSQKYQSATVTPSASEPHRYYIELNYKETPVTTNETQSKTELFWLSVTDNKVSNVEIITTK